MNEKEIEKIKKFTGKDFDESKIFTFEVKLCDNEIDRDGEKFTAECLKGLAELYIGKTGIFDHEPSAKNQVARIYETELITENGKKTSDGEDYTYIKAKAYMLKNADNEGMIESIKAGITKETSVGCSVGKITCSVCGNDARGGECLHSKGEEYNGVKCFFKLEEPRDAYEWSFVAVPAQKSAGVIKSYKIDGSKENFDKLKAIAIDYKNELKGGVIKGVYSILPEIDMQVIEMACEEMSIENLRNIKNAIADLSEKMSVRKSELIVNKEKEVMPLAEYLI